MEARKEKNKKKCSMENYEGKQFFEGYIPNRKGNKRSIINNMEKNIVKLDYNSIQNMYNKSFLSDFDEFLDFEEKKDDESHDFQNCIEHLDFSDDENCQENSPRIFSSPYFKRNSGDEKKSDTTSSYWSYDSSKTFKESSSTGTIENSEYFDDDNFFEEIFCFDDSSDQEELITDKDFRLERLSNHFETIGIKPTDDIQKIKKEFKKKAKILHPDKNFGSEESKIKFQNLSFAYYEIMGVLDKDQFRE